MQPPKAGRTPLHALFPARNALLQKEMSNPLRLAPHSQSNTRSIPFIEAHASLSLRRKLQTVLHIGAARKRVDIRLLRAPGLAREGDGADDSSRGRTVHVNEVHLGVAGGGDGVVGGEGGDECAGAGRGGGEVLGRVSG
jgi:hypothetical protein